MSAPADHADQMTGDRTETLVRGRWLFIGGDQPKRFIDDGALLIAEGTIRRVGTWDELRGLHPEAPVLGSADVAIIPGLIDAHHHGQGITTAQHGTSDRILESWLLTLGRQRAAEPALDATISAARLLQSGITSVVDVQEGGGTPEEFHSQMSSTLSGYDTTGIRVALAAGFTEQHHLISGAGEDEKFLSSLPPDLREIAASSLPGPGAIDADSYFGVMDDLRSGIADRDRLDLWFGPPGPHWVSRDQLIRIAEEAERHDTGIQTHVTESIHEKMVGPRSYGKPTVLHLDELGILGPRLSLAHGVWLTEEEIEVLAESGTAVSHNPSSNLRLRAGIAPLNALLAAGVTTGLGLDAMGLNDDDAMFSEMRMALRLHRGPTLKSPAPSVADAFKMATGGGAKLLRRDHDLGKLEEGYEADLAVVRLDRITHPWVAPEADPLELVMMRAQAGDVETVLIGGEVVLSEGQPTRFDLQAAEEELANMLDAQAYPSDHADAIDRLRPYLEAHYASWGMPPLDPYTEYNSRT